MAAIDSLLGIAEMKKASGVALASDEIPALLTGGGRTPLTMPPLSATMLDALLVELLNEQQQQELRGAGLVETEYQSAQGTYTVKARLSASAAGQKVTLTVRRGALAARPVTAATPAVRTTPAPAPATSTATGTETRTETEVETVEAGGGGGRLTALLVRAAERGASDVVLTEGSPPVLRMQGELRSEPGPVIESAELLAFFQPLLGERASVFQRTGSVDLTVALPDAAGGTGTRLRANLFRHARGVAASLRPIWNEIPTLEALNLPASLLELVRPRTGLVLLTGATGSGKSTTLAVLLEHLNRTRACHIVTLEDPIEYLYNQRRSIIHQREVGRDVDSFATGLRAALREDPDVLLVGEMRDPETIRLVLTAAETGHLVLSTLHSGSAAMAIERVLDAFGETHRPYVRQQLAGVLRAVLAQQLLPGTAGDRVPALELLTVNHAVAAQIREGRTHMLATQMEIGAVEGMVPLERSLVDLVRSGRVSRAAAMAAAHDPDALQAALQGSHVPR